MPLTIDYYAGLSSPWNYLGHQRFCQMCEEHGATVNFKPVDFAAIFGATGGLPLAKRHPARQAYRWQELDRWRKELNVELIPQPKHFPMDPKKAALMTILATKEGADDLALGGAYMKAIWAENRDLSDDDTLVQIADGLGLEGARLLAESQTLEILNLYEAHTQEAIEKGVFGAPSYVIGEEIFWGQDRLFFVEKKLKEEK